MPYCVVGHGREPSPFKLYYELHGDTLQPRKRLLFIAGLSVSCQSWDQQYPVLASTQGYLCCIFDNRGAGFSECPPGPYKTSAMAQDVLELLLHLGWSSDIHLIGVSMGGMISLEFASQFPEFLASLTLISTTAGAPPKLSAIFGLFGVATIRDPDIRLMRNMELVFPQGFLASASSDPRFPTQRERIFHIAKHRTTLTRATTTAGAAAHIAASLGHSVSDSRLNAIRLSLPGKVQVLTGTWDKLVDPSNSAHLAKVLACPLHTYIGGGHSLPTEQADWVNNLICTLCEQE
ncbi:Alpha/Beta hydrolase protein [Polychytrium aggregatum]|uniref:Alpha/Beta hydrolase protein n=1 Tax=Polychytrium aggregatum TaxID=110093 RepID=UPI0022FDB0AC|nr:Alpha/Beta hydrolase protein [Polychytrium aggregatum]KAI9193070.1 Alpha/Beta hydrolase protein [Polychytrium aggregatum]